jgi:SWI/SNF-related matrix-associated actin-dependent regulator of chromatin subfamily A member 5
MPHTHILSVVFASSLCRNTQVDQEALSAAHYLLRPFCLRRLKSEVEVTLPPKVETRIATPLSSQQIFWYRR